MRYFNFDNLIEKYACDFILVKAINNAYDALGDLVTETETTNKRGAIISINEYKVYRSDGVITAKDKELFMKESLGNIDEAFVIYENNKYKVEMNPQNNNQFTGVWQYTLKWISAFEEGDKVD